MKLSAPLKVDTRSHLPPAKMRRAFLSRLAMGLAVLCLSGGCSEEKNSPFSREQMWEWLAQQHVQEGMPVDAASAVMEKAGFVCSSHSKTSTKIVDVHKTSTNGVFDFVLCEREDGSPPIKRHWEITFVREGSLVKAIGVRYRDVYPRPHATGEKAGQ
jgi:hypothetical protein